MRRLILCIGCGRQLACDGYLGLRFCNQCRIANICWLIDNDVEFSEAFVTCSDCVEKEIREMKKGVDYF
jgi:hypothetical protein